MEMDFKYRQYNMNNLEQKDSTAATEAAKPYQEVLDYFEEHKDNFKFEEFSKVLKTINSDVDLVLSDSTKVKVFASNNLIKVGVRYPNGTYFLGTWTTIQDEEELLNAL
jgi:hypothetical protein